MKNQQLVELLKKIVQKEIREYVQGDEFRKVLRESVGPVVVRKVESLLTEMEQKVAQHPQTTKLVDAVGKQMPPKAKQVQKPLRKTMPTQFAKDPILNGIMSELQESMARGEIVPPNADGGTGMTTPFMVNEGVGEEQEDWPEMAVTKDARAFAMLRGNGEMPARPDSDHVSDMRVQQMLPQVDTNGRPLNLSATQLPDNVKNAIGRDYRGVMKALKTIRR